MTCKPSFKLVILTLLALTALTASCRQHRSPRSISFKRVIEANESQSEEENLNQRNSSQEDLELSDSVSRFCRPQSPNKISEQILRRTSYIVSYNKETKNPNWVAWKLTAEHTDGVYPRLKNFHEESEVLEPRATPQDYRGSGWSRGHMCPAGDNKWSREAMYDSFSLVNVCPQNSKLNSGVWNCIETDCRRWARQYGEVYIVCGPVFMNKKHETIGPNVVMVPEAFFKVVLCLMGDPKALGIVVRNTEGTKKKDLYYNTVDQVEQITGYDFFPSLPDDIENKVEAQADINDWK